MSYYLNEDKLKEKIEALNKNGGNWEAVAGLYWYPEVTRFSSTDDVKQQPSGILLKLFINNDTGEFRSFPAGMFE